MSLLLTVSSRIHNSWYFNFRKSLYWMSCCNHHPEHN